MIEDKNFTKLAFTKSVKDMQEQFGSRQSYARVEKSGDRYKLTSREIQFIETRDSFYMATVGENGWPYVQYRGGPKGFLKVLDDETIGFADFRGNKQYISAGNINATKKASLFLMDYPSQSRLKIWAEAEIKNPDDDSELNSSFRDESYDAVIERIIRFQIHAFDWNCPQHIVPRYTINEMHQYLEHKDL